MKSPRQQQAEGRLQTAMQMLEALMPSGMGIALFVFERDTDKGHMGYAANARRSDMRKALTEFLGKWEADAAGQPFVPLTLDAFEAWVKTLHTPTSNVTEALAAFRNFVNSSPTNSEEVSHQ